jgi:IclR family pca regulon transcriptional regulator
MTIAAQPLLEEVSRALDESSSVAVLEEGSVVFVARSATRRIMSVTLRVGSRVPSYCTALGRVLLAHLEPEALTIQLASTDFRAHTKHTVPSRKKLDDILLTVRKQDYALNDQELEIGLRSIAVPVRNAVGEVVAAMNVGAQASRVSLRDMVDTFLPVLRSAADRLGGQLPPTQ